MDADLAGKWIGPMHPEIVKDDPGSCPICGMPLVRVETYGFVQADVGKEAPLVIPASAPLLTGKRAIVYVAVPGTDGLTYEGREISLGPRAGDYYLVESGLREGDRVVTKGNFKIDSALQIMAKPSMMNPEGGGPSPGHAHQGSAAKHPRPTPTGSGPKQDWYKPLQEIPQAFRRQLSDVTLAYMQLSDALVEGKADRAKTASKGMEQAVDKVDMGLLKEKTHIQWMKDLERLKNIIAKIEQADNLQNLRAEYALLSESLAVALKRFGHSMDGPVRVFHCPMAFDGRGAEWLQLSQDVKNPYFGAAMPKCGSQTAVIQSGVNPR